MSKAKEFWIARDRKNFIESSSCFGFFDSEPCLFNGEWIGKSCFIAVDLSTNFVKALGVEIKPGQKKKFRLVEVQ